MNSEKSFPSYGNGAGQHIDSNVQTGYQLNGKLNGVGSESA
jgi:hypothetical protein